MALEKTFTKKDNTSGNYWKIKNTPYLLGETGRVKIVYELFFDKATADTQKNVDPSVHKDSMLTLSITFLKSIGPDVKYTKAELSGIDLVAFGDAELKARDSFLSDALDVLE